jgi:hypothetical protein
VIVPTATPAVSTTTTTIRNTTTDSNTARVRPVATSTPCTWLCTIRSAGTGSSHRVVRSAISVKTGDRPMTPSNHAPAIGVATPTPSPSVSRPAVQPVTRHSAAAAPKRCCRLITTSVYAKAGACHKIRNDDTTGHTASEASAWGMRPRKPVTMIWTPIVSSAVSTSGV